MQVNHNSGGMAQLNSTDALQTVHSGPVSGIAASEHLALQAELGNIVATDMGGTSFDIGIVVEGGVKHYDFNPVIERWMVRSEEHTSELQSLMRISYAVSCLKKKNLKKKNNNTT